jgi:hypothetical protein
MEPPAEPSPSTPYIPLYLRQSPPKIQPNPALIEDPRIAAVYSWLSKKSDLTFAEIRKIHIIESYFATPKPFGMKEQAFTGLQWYATDVVLDERIPSSSHDRMNELEEIYRNYA